MLKDKKAKVTKEKQGRGGAKPKTKRLSQDEMGVKMLEMQETHAPCSLKTHKKNKTPDLVKPRDKYFVVLFLILLKDHLHSPMISLLCSD
jgi:hypothetical protein